MKWAGRMAEAAERLAAGQEVKRPAYRIYPTPSLPMALFAIHGGLRLGLGKRTVDMDLCDLCGRCATACPAGAINVARSGPVFARTCIGCWACFNVCPKEAVRSNLPMVRPSTYYHGLRCCEEVMEKVGLPK
jgi:NAD-dependent dihydropyrimidine dehydrogenase PreA subunit